MILFVGMCACVCVCTQKASVLMCRLLELTNTKVQVPVIILPYSIEYYVSSTKI